MKDQPLQQGKHPLQEGTRESKELDLKPLQQG